MIDISGFRLTKTQRKNKELVLAIKKVADLIASADRQQIDPDFQELILFQLDEAIRQNNSSDQLSFLPKDNYLPDLLDKLKSANFLLDMMDINDNQNMRIHAGKVSVPTINLPQPKSET